MLIIIPYRQPTPQPPPRTTASTKYNVTEVDEAVTEAAHRAADVAATDIEADAAVIEANSAADVEAAEVVLLEEAVVETSLKPVKTV